MGVSNYNVEQMRAFERTRKLDALQPPYSLFRRDIEREILPYCEAAGIGVLVYGPLAHGLLGSTPNFARDIRPLLRQSDRESMDFAFGLWDYNDVRT